MGRQVYRLTLLIGALAFMGGALHALPSFPGAEGWGSDTVAGRGPNTTTQKPTVYVVTNKNAAGPGSFVEAMQATGPRFIVFRVSGVIDTKDLGELNGNLDNSYVTVAGQTSPGGITLISSNSDVITHYKRGFHDAAFRHIRFRGTVNNYDTVSLNSVYNVIFDHCDVSGASDETLDLSESYDITFQWGTVTNSGVCSGCQTRGFLIANYGGPGHGHHISIHHNFMAHHDYRFPEIHWDHKDVTDFGKIDIRNNVNYNGGQRFISIGGPDSTPSKAVQMNIVGNTFKLGVRSPNDPIYMLSLTDKIMTHGSDNNLILKNGSVQANAYKSRMPNPPVPDVAFPMASITTQSASDAYDLVLGKAGALPHDPMNVRVVNEIKTATGDWGKLDDPLLWATGTPPAPPADTDLDGISDDWETAHGLNPSFAGDNVLDMDGDGYLNIEEYINELAEALTGPQPSGPSLPERPRRLRVQ